MSLMIKTRDSGGVTIIDLQGRLVLGDECNQLREQVKTLLAANQKKIVLNLAEVSFIDSAGVGTLVASFTSAKAQEGEMKMANLTKKFKETLQITRLLTVFEVYESEAEAVASFK